MGDERARLFVALELPGVARRALARWQQLALPARAGLRPVAPEALHVTLCFLGWQPASQAQAIATVTREAVAATDPAAQTPPAPRLSIGQAVWLPRRRPRVLAIELSEAQNVLTRLQGTLSDRLRAGGWYEPEHRRFLPHVTVARVGRNPQQPSGGLPPGAPGAPGAPAARAGGLLRTDPLPDLPSLNFAGPQITLYRSRLHPGGAQYEALAWVALGAH